MLYVPFVSIPIFNFIFIPHLNGYYIAFDHMRFLGNSLEAICEKKSGIFKANKPALIGPNVPHSVALVRSCTYCALLCKRFMYFQILQI